MYIEVAFNLPILSTFTYKVNPVLEDAISIGKRVIAPWGNKNNILVGYIVEIKNNTYIEKIKEIKKVKEIIDVIDKEPLFSEELLKLAQFVSYNYITSLGEVLHNISYLSADTDLQIKTIIKLKETAKNYDYIIKSALQKDIINILEEKKEISLATLKKYFPTQNILASIYSLRDKNIITIEKILKEEKKNKKYIRYIQLASFDNKITTLTEKQEKIINILQTHGNSHKELSLAKINELLGSNASAIINNLVKKGILKYINKEIKRDYYQEDIISYTYPKEELKLTPNQRKAYDSIVSYINEGKFGVFLLHGITGSGKTEVYLQLLKAAIDKNKTGLVLVPEIALTWQMIERIRSRFSKDRVVALHSKLSKGEKFDQWREILMQKIDILIGPRSCIFAPLKNLGIIIIDEEHDTAYKQSDITPRYHAKEVALKHAQMHSIPIVLGSATPSLESYHYAREGRYFYLSLPERIDKRPLPVVEVVDMKHEAKKGNLLLSRKLEEKIKERLLSGEKIILFLNRRGFSRFIQCRDCGFSYKCPNCSISLVFHRSTERRVLICHYCGHEELIGLACVQCQGTKLYCGGFGTQKLEEELKKKFPYARLQRLDTDVSQKKSIERILKDFKEGRIDILIGTQLVTKGLDIEDVTLVGVIDTDVLLNLADFRAAERCFSMLVQVSGRAGRGKKPGLVIIQTYTPAHYSIWSAKKHSYKDFYLQELSYRKQTLYPPYTHLANIIIKDKNEKEARKKANNLYNLLKPKDNIFISSIFIIGPAPCKIYKLENFFRFQILIKTQDNSSLLQFLHHHKEILTRKNIIVDVDPQDMF